ncbi:MULTISPECIES: hypothetical protein [Clostridia]|jgi:hypothetical protein|uniref:hypothetical protein n=1 Tax=Clostridia TaxID=186801 RepID=UPI0013643393|nr:MULTISPECIES: hypothetical protein [Anaerotruncus]
MTTEKMQVKFLNFLEFLRIFPDTLTVTENDFLSLNKPALANPITLSQTSVSLIPSLNFFIITELYPLFAIKKENISTNQAKKEWIASATRFYPIFSPHTNKLVQRSRSPLLF